MQVADECILRGNEGIEKKEKKKIGDSGEIEELSRGQCLKLSSSSSCSS